MVAGEICENPFDPEAGAEPPDGAPLPAISNGLVEVWLKPVVCGDEDFDVVSDWKASSTDAAAPRASNIAKLRPMPRSAAFTFARLISKRRAIAEKPIKSGLFVLPMVQ
jgi:hypothetical protein